MATYTRKAILIVFFVGTFTTYDVPAKRFHSIAGPFKPVFKRLENCGDDSMANIINYTLQDVTSRQTYKIGPTYNINVELGLVINDTLSIGVSLASWSNMGGWKENAHILNFPRACFSLENFGKRIWTALMMSCAGEMWACPHYPGIYRIQNFTVMWDDIPIKEFFYGRWRIDGRLRDAKRETLVCLRVYSNTVPR